MAVLSRLLIGSQQRLDLPDLLSIDSYAASDFRYLIKSLVGSTPLVLKGFDIIDAPSAIGQNNVSIRVADSALYNADSSAGSFYYGLPEGNVLSEPISPILRSNAINYIYITLSSSGQGQDTRAFFDVDLNGGSGGEFNQDINTQSVLKVDVNVSVSTFPNGTVPIAKIETGANGIIVSITDCRNMMFRLGSGGVNPNPTSKFSFRSLPSSIYERDEPLLTINNPESDNSFQGGDKNIYNLKEWMDVVMTKLLELSGTSFWYESTPTLNLANIFGDALGTSIKSKGRWSHDGSNPGKITWSEDIVIRKMNDPRDIIIRGSSVNGKTLLDDQVMWVELSREKSINELDSPVVFKNGESYINAPNPGVGGSFEGLKKGDWIKRHGDNSNLYLRVEEFYDDYDADGGAISPSDAKSIKLSGVYTGPSVTDSAVYSKGEYTNSDIKVSNRNSSDLFLAGGDLFWLANRSDTIQSIGGIQPTILSDVVISDADGIRARLNFSDEHGLLDGDRIVISEAGSQNGIYQVEVESPNTVIINTISTDLTTNAIVSYAVVTTAVRKTDADYQLESANHNFESNQTVVISGTTGSTYDGSYLINYRSDTKFQIPHSATISATGGTATCARVNLRTEFGAARVIQGESIDINEPDTFNILKFIGMDSLSQTNPVYQLPSEYNTLAGFQNFNSSESDSLTTRVSKLTAMMADRVQDRGSRIIGRATYRNEGSGSNQVVSVSGSIIIEKPGSPQQAISVPSPFTLAANEALVCQVNRDSSSTITAMVQSLGSPFLLEENKIILFYRFSGTSVYSWDGHEIKNSSSWTSNDYEASQNKNIVVQDVGGINYNYNPLTGSGVISYNSSGTVRILIPGSAENTINCGAINALSVSTRTVSNNQSVWIRVNRSAAKTFTTVSTDLSYQDSNSAGALYITDTISAPTDQDTLVLYSVKDGLLMKHHHFNPAGNIYEEDKVGVVTPTTESEFAAPLVSGSTVSLPKDSRENGSNQYYVVGSGQLQVFLNGQRLRRGDDYNESGSTGTLSSSISILQDLLVGDILSFRIDGNSAVYFTPSPTVIENLQDAYEGGNVINISAGSPIVLNGAAGSKLLQINGDIGVTGVVDPKGISFTKESATPLLSSQDGLWIDSDGKLIQQRSGLSSVNITESITNPSSFITAGDGLSYSDSTINVNTSTTGGIQITSDALNIKKPASSGLVTDTTGLYVDTSTTGGVEVVSNKVQIKKDPAGAISTTSSGAKVSVDGSSVIISGNALKVNAAAPIYNSGTALRLAHDETLNVDPSNRLTVYGSPRLMQQWVANNDIDAGMVVSIVGNPFVNYYAEITQPNMLYASRIIGVTPDFIYDGETGIVVNYGPVYIPGASFTVGQTIYLSSTVSGGLTTTKPTEYGKPIVIIGTAVSSSEIFVKPQILGVASNVYLESTAETVNSTSPVTKTLPVDSRAGNSVRYYTVGDAFLTVWLNGQKLRVGDDYNEVGSSGSQSNQIQILQDLVVGDILEYRIERDQAIFSAMKTLP